MISLQIISHTERRFLSLQSRHPYLSSAWFESLAEMNMLSFGSISTWNIPCSWLMNLSFFDSLILGVESWVFYQLDSSLTRQISTDSHFLAPQTRTGTHLWTWMGEGKFERHRMIVQAEKIEHIVLLDAEQAWSGIVHLTLSTHQK